jgi:hypothetical protein
MAILGRRDFLFALAATTVAWPRAAHAQQPAMPVIGLLISASPEPYAPMMAAFRQGLSETGYVDGKNVAIEYRWARTWRLNIAGRKIKLIDCQPSRQIWFANRWP